MLKSTARRKYIETKKIRVESKDTVQARAPEDDVPYIDTLRGLSIIAFIFVKAGWGNYAFIAESLWNGYTVGDLPKYMIAWVMGICIPISLSHQEHVHKKQIMKSIILKSILMYCMGSIFLQRFRVQQKLSSRICEVHRLPAKTGYSILSGLNTVPLPSLWKKQKEIYRCLL